MDGDEEVEQSLHKRELRGLKNESDSESDGEFESEKMVNPLDGERSTDTEEEENFENVSEEDAVEPFNLVEEREEGIIENGEFIKTERGGKFDTWLDGIDANAIRKARQAEAVRQAQPPRPQLSEVEALEQLGSLLKPAETATEAIENTSDCGRVEGITVACSALLSGLPGVYDLEREELNRIYHAQSGRTFKRKRVWDNWKFKWPGQDEVHGPFTAVEMQAWLDHGYFANGASVSPFEEEDFRDISQVRF